MRVSTTSTQRWGQWWPAMRGQEWGELRTTLVAGILKLACTRVTKGLIKMWVPRPPPSYLEAGCQDEGRTAAFDLLSMSLMPVVSPCTPAGTPHSGSPSLGSADSHRHQLSWVPGQGDLPFRGGRAGGGLCGQHGPLWGALHPAGSSGL